MMLFVTIRGEVIDNQRAGITRGDEVNSDSNDRHYCEEVTKASTIKVLWIGERVHDIEPWKGSNTRNESSQHKKGMCSTHYKGACKVDLHALSASLALK
jgi:hypothetical protein